MNDDLPPLSERQLPPLGNSEQRIQHYLFLLQVQLEAKAAVDQSQKEMEALAITAEERAEIGERLRQQLEKQRIQSVHDELARKAQLTLIDGGKS